VVLGLTGKYCSGKNMAGRVFTDRGWYELDVDRFGHDALTEKTAQVVRVFGEVVLSVDGSIDRKRLGSIVFNNKAYLRRLESIIHPEMADRCKQEINSNKNRNILINAAILHHMGLNGLCDSVLWVESDLFTRISRARARDSISLIQILKRIYGQRKLDAKYWVEDVDIHIIRNMGTRVSLETEINTLIDMFEERV
jgi:dephospho-CoA kinase